MKLNKLNIAVAALAAVALAGCKNEDLSRQHYDNKLFISATNFTDEMLIKAANSSYEREITAGIAKPVGQDISIEFAAAPELFDHYRQAFYDEDVKLLSEEFYQFDETKTRIQAGSVASVPVTIRFVDVNLLDKNERYVLPVTIRSVSGIDVLPSARSVYYIFKGAALINVVAGITENRAWPDWKDASPVTNMRTFTLEALINGNAFKNQISTIMGIEGICGVRFGDVKVDPDCIQICHDSYQPAATDKPFDKEKWYHVAAVWTGSSWDIYINGQYATGVETQGETIDLTSDNSGGFYLGASYGGGRTLNGYVAECRVWTRALSQSEIANNMNYVDPTSDGLLAYWRMNAWEPNDSGSGNIVRDLTGHGYDAVGGSSNPTMMDTKWN